MSHVDGEQRWSEPASLADIGERLSNNLESASVSLLGVAKLRDFCARATPARFDVESALCEMWVCGLAA